MSNRSKPDNKLSSKINAIIEQSHKKHPNDPLLAKFIGNFYLYFPFDDEQDLDAAFWSKIGEEMFDFIQTRKLGASKIKVDNSIVNQNSIKMINDDKPFIVDSVKEELIKKELKISAIIHPVMKVKRDANGGLVDIGMGDEVDDSYKMESIIYIQSSSIANSKLAKQLEASLTDVMLMVQVAVEEWPLMLAAIDNIERQLSPHAATEPKVLKICTFLQWLVNHNFIFLGYNHFKIDRDKEIKADNANKLGLFTTMNDLNEIIINEVNYLLNNQTNNHEKLLFVSKINKISQVHRRSNIDLIVFCHYDSQGVLTGFDSFIGLFTSALSYQSINSIPLIRDKRAYVLDKSGSAPVSFRGKELVSIIESLPRDELFQMSEEELYEISLAIYSLLVKPDVQLFTRVNNSQNLLSCLVAFPKERINYEINEKIQQILQDNFGGMITSHHIQVGNLPVAYLYSLVNLLESGHFSKKNLKNAEDALKELISNWHDELYMSLFEKFGEIEGDYLFKQYKSSCSASYRERFKVDSEVIDDIIFAEKVKKNPQEILFNIYKTDAEQNNFSLNLKIYSYQHKISLSEIMPVLENIGFKTVDEQLFPLAVQDHKEQIWIHDFRLQIGGYETQSISELKEYEFLETEVAHQYIEEALEQIWHGKVHNDQLNKLILRASISARQVVMLRAIGKYLRQTSFIYSEDYVYEVITRHPKLGKLFIEYIETKFDPSGSKNNVSKHLLKLVKDVEERLSKITNNIEDLVIRKFFEIIQAITRTNYFQKDANNQLKDYISFKINSGQISDLPLPVPFAEIFVYSTRTEGIHLRGGKVARGGLRWSDRSEDFRTEVLGLMKAQVTKNAVIVPSGAKGGFVVKQSIARIGRDAYLKEGKECYKIFLRGLLDITDNLINGKAVTPQDIVRYDDEDPYLVVAADKGTATFSDIANQISAEYGFWLGDAFASGGSAGYDHKKMGITAKGAWISVTRHLAELGINTAKDEFTVVGIGDMSGDVFGNGMLLSEHILLLAAFNHAYIFIDPSPIASVSYTERQRLFNLPGSNWNDYDASLISKGGAVFDRKAKIINLTAEIKQKFDIEEDSLTPDQLMRKILTAKVDLLWNGGIGTYIKATDEVNEQVGDKANDAIRVDGSELRCKAIGEGGNLGCTQKGRIEYSFAGGKINTDFIDNSAGVDCSDHEVNIKIAFKRAMENQVVTLEKRNKLLAEMTDHVASLVLQDNFLQTQVITMQEQQGYSALEMYSRLMNRLESSKMLNRNVEFLPSKQEIIKRDQNKQGFTRPEIAVLVAYSKIAIYNDLIETDLADDEYFQTELLNYFPKVMQQKFSAEILVHPLRREIITTSIANSIVNRMGVSFYHYVLDDTDAKNNDVAKAYIITHDAFELDNIWQELEKNEAQISLQQKKFITQEINKLVSRCVFWLLRNSSYMESIAKMVAILKPAIKELMQGLEASLTGEIKTKFENNLLNIRAMNLSPMVAKTIASITVLSSSYDIVFVASKSCLPITKVCKLYFELGSRYNFDWLRTLIDMMEPESYWQRLSLKSLKDDLYDMQRRLTYSVLSCSKTSKPIDEWENLNLTQVERYTSFVNDLKSYESVDFHMLVVASKRMESLIN